MAVARFLCLALVVAMAADAYAKSDVLVANGRVHIVSLRDSAVSHETTYGAHPLPPDAHTFVPTPASRRSSGNVSQDAAGICGSDDRVVIPPAIVKTQPYSNTALILFNVRYKTGGKGSLLCSGYQISPNLVFTAGHCMVEGGAKGYTFTSGTVYFGTTGGRAYVGSASICGYAYFTDWLNAGTNAADLGLYYLCSPVVQQSYYRIERIDKLTNYGVPSVLKSYGYPASVGNGLSLVESVGGCSIALGRTCNVNNVLACNMPLSGGMSGGPVIDATTGYVFASNDFTCNVGCTSGYTPLTSSYPITALMAVFGV